MSKLCIISPYYPTKESSIFAFVDELVSKIADNDVECSVITPILLGRKNRHGAQTRRKITSEGRVITIHCPTYLVPHKRVFGVEPIRLFIRSYSNAVVRAYTKHVHEADAFYGHFLFPSGITAAYMGKRFNKPSFVACGESNLLNGQQAYMIYKDLIHTSLSGVVSVSTQMKSQLRRNEIVSDDTPIVVLPNAIDTSKFRIMNKLDCRKKLGIDDSKFVVCFVGHFIERKGPLRVLRAIERHGDVYGIFVGGDNLPTQSERIVFCGKVPHDELSVYLNAADVFVLPTLAEGCCNAIIEAMACGLPIISSNLPFNDDILNDTCSIRIDPNNIDEIAAAIESLKNDVKKRESMSIAAQMMARKLDINERARTITGLIEQHIERNQHVIDNKS